MAPRCVTSICGLYAREMPGARQERGVRPGPVAQDADADLRERRDVLGPEQQERTRSDRRTRARGRASPGTTRCPAGSRPRRCRPGRARSTRSGSTAARSRRPATPRSTARPARTTCSVPSAVSSDCSSSAAHTPGSAVSAAASRSAGTGCAASGPQVDHAHQADLVEVVLQGREVRVVVRERVVVLVGRVARGPSRCTSRPAGSARS